MKTKILRVLCLLLVISMVAFPVNAAETPEPEFQLKGTEVTLYGDDVTVEIPFITPKSYGIEGVFSLTAAETNEIALTKILTAFEPVEDEDLVDEETGKVMWVNNDFNGPEEDELVIGVYTIPADTAEGEYTVSFELRVFTGEDYEPIEPNETYTATITVIQHECSDVTTDEDHLCDDPNCKNEDAVTEHTGGVANCVCGKVCDQCGKPYTSIDQENHYSDEVSYVNVTEETHTVKHSCCEAEDDPVPHDFTNGDCVCGAEEPVTDITVVYKGAALANAFTVEGNVVTVTYSMACKVGYWDATAGKYVALTATKVSDNCYSFTAPEGVTEVLLVVKGDVDGNGSVNLGDRLRLAKSMLPANNVNRAPITEAWQIFVADVDESGAVNLGDRLRLAKSMLPINNANRQTLEW